MRNINHHYIFRYLSHLLLTGALVACSAGGISSGGGVSNGGVSGAGPAPVANPGTTAPDSVLKTGSAMDAPMGAKSDPDFMEDVCHIFPMFGFFHGKAFGTYLDARSAYPADWEEALPPKGVWISAEIEDKGWTLPFLVMADMVPDPHDLKVRLIKTESIHKLIPNYCQDITLDGLKPDGSNGLIENLRVADGEVVWIYYDRHMELGGKYFPLADCGKLLKNESAYREFTKFYCLGFLGAFQFNIFLPSNFLPHDNLHGR